jgi:hypothetical protein
MNVGLVFAGSLCFVLAAGHAFVGRAVLDLLPRNLHATRFGDGAFTRGLFVFTWHALTLWLTTSGAVLIALARGEPADYRGPVVFLVGAAYAAATVLLAWRSRRRPSDLLRIPVWVLVIVIIVICLLNT